AVWDEQSSNGTSRIDLDLIQGTLALGTDAWQLQDYRRVLESGLRHDFGDLQRVGLEQFSITFSRRGVAWNVRDAGGTVKSESPEVGVATLQAYELNGQRVRE